MPIGKLGRGLSKKHPGFRSNRRRNLPPQTLPVPPVTGFTQLQGQATYDAVDHRLVLTLTARRAEGNLGPGIFERESFEDWHRHQVDGGEVRRLLRSRLEGLEARLKARVTPERQLYLDVCTPDGQDPSRFLQSTCAKCRCWYCELSAA